MPEQNPLKQLIKQELPPELADNVIKSGRLFPCVYFYLDYGSAIGLCTKNNKKECLNCPDYESSENKEK